MLAYFALQARPEEADQITSDRMVTFLIMRSEVAFFAHTRFPGGDQILALPLSVSHCGDTASHGIGFQPRVVESRNDGSSVLEEASGEQGEENLVEVEIGSDPHTGKDLEQAAAHSVDKR
jgi:hypothetical protein